MRIIKRYDQYIKENKKVNEDINENPGSIEEMPEVEAGSPGDEIEEPVSAMPGDNDEFPEEVSNNYEEEEEEGHQYKGNMMLKQLADKLGTEVINNSIEYKGKKINFYSETEMFHVDRKKFKTADEVVSYLNQESSTPENTEETEEPIVGQEDPAMMESKKHRSYRTTRKFESFRK